MVPALRYSLIGLAIIIVLIVLYIVGITIFNKRRLLSMNNAINQLFSEYIKENPDFKFEAVSKREYDYLFETYNYTYYIKIVPNFNNQEITVNNSVKWQLRKSFNDESLRFVEGIEPLMRMDINQTSKKIKKLYIVYPNARSLLKYINECEMEFVHADTDVYGTNIITYVNLNENRDLLDL
ncbi:MAG: hypothetical protein IKP77_02845 [Acholeplasmatales bacterium]|nr:hypothetical protein [Acholeplasmatales bacterium]